MLLIADDSKLAYLSFTKNSNSDFERHVAARRDYDLIIGKENQKSKSGLKWLFDKYVLFLKFSNFINLSSFFETKKG